MTTRALLPFLSLRHNDFPFLRLSCLFCKMGNCKKFTALGVGRFRADIHVSEGFQENPFPSLGSFSSSSLPSVSPLASQQSTTQLPEWSL